MSGRMSRRGFLAAGAAAVAGAGVAVDAFGVEARELVITRHDVPVPGLPAALDGVTLAHVTDTHLPANAHVVREAHDAIRSLAPDLVVLTGDIVESADGLGAAREFVAGAPGRSGTFALMGNWERQGGVPPEMAEAAYAAAGAELLVNRIRTVQVNGFAVAVAGFDDWVAGEVDLQLAAGAIDAPLRLWMTHAPGLADVLPASPTPPALVLAGHTHGGQIRLPGLPPVLPEGSGTHVAGWYRPQGLPLYVSRGVGTTGIRARFRCRAELPIFTFRRA